MSTPPKILVELSAADLELLGWRLCQPDYSEIGARWDRHRTGMTPDMASMDLYQRLMSAWDDWYLEGERGGRGAGG